MVRTALILSSGRTGTRFLARYLDANYDEVVALHEPPPSRLLRLASHAHLAGRLSRSALESALRRARAPVLARTRAALYVESNPFLAGFVDVVDAVYGDPLIVHVVRDPRDYVRSSLGHGTASGWKGLANRFVPYWYPDVRRLLALDHAPTWLERAAGVWTLVNRRLGEAGRGNPRYHRLRYEDLFDAEHSGLRALVGLLGLDYREDGLAVGAGERINASRRDALPPWRSWTAEQCRSLDALCGPLMREYGYGEEPAWRERT